MAKETAHQIGTPLSSLMGWIALLKEQEIAPASVEEMQKDIERLEVITERFSKVGSLPDLEEGDIVALTQSTIDYLKKRTGSQVEWEVHLPTTSIHLPLNAALLSWTLENLVKNGLDAMKGIGRLRIDLIDKKDDVRIWVQDKAAELLQDLKQLFRPGFDQSRGWGLGLSLARRIIHDYHNGFIQVKSTQLGQGTTFELMLPK